MADQSLHRTDELLTELIELVETARAVPMSGSCVLGREHVLDLLDSLREAIPTDVEAARGVIARRGAILAQAREEAGHTREQSGREADVVLADARHQADAMIAAAEERAADTVQRAADEHSRMLTSTAVHQAAAESAAELRASAEGYHDERIAAADVYDRAVRAEADRYALEVRAEAETHASRLAGESRDYADRTLADLGETLRHAAATADQGRAELARRSAGVVVGDAGGGPGDDGYSEAVLSA